MSLRVLDTDILSLYYEGHTTVRQRVDAHPTEDLAITAITVEEQLSGWYSLLRKAKHAKTLAHAYERLGDTVRFLARWPILSFTEAAIERRAQLRRLRLKIGSSDLAIAAITLEENGILVTRNTRDFKQIPNLSIEDWSK